MLIPILIFFVCTVSAQKSNDKTGSLLWKVSGKGLEFPSYIYGTHHLFPLSFLDSVAGLKKAFAASEQMVGEIVMQDMAALGVEIQKAGMMPPDTTWQMLLSEEDYRFVDEQLTAFFGVGLQAFGMFKPSIASLQYVAFFYQKKFPKENPLESPDLWFQQQAVSRGIPVFGLETVQDQIYALFEVASLKRQAEDLVCALKNLDYTETLTKRLNNMYRTADLYGLAELFKEEGPCPSNDKQATALNKTRNDKWLEKLPAIMADKPSFIAVGLLHLVGEEGILYGLEKAGYKVEAVISE